MHHVVGEGKLLWQHTHYPFITHLCSWACSSALYSFPCPRKLFCFKRAPFWLKLSPGNPQQKASTNDRNPLKQALNKRIEIRNPRTPIQAFFYSGTFSGSLLRGFKRKIALERPTFDETKRYSYPFIKAFFQAKSIVFVKGKCGENWQSTVTINKTPVLVRNPF